MGPPFLLSNRFTDAVVVQFFVGGLLAGSLRVRIGVAATGLKVASIMFLALEHQPPLYVRIR